MEEKKFSNGIPGDKTEEEFFVEPEENNFGETLKKLKEKLKKCEAEKSDYLAGWQRTKADFINARKEEEDKRKDIIKFSEKNILLDFLNLADSFDRLFANKEGWDKIEKNWQQGMAYLHTQLVSLLKNKGVEHIESVGKIFDPREHESIGEIDVDSKENDGMVMEESRKGYKMHGVIIRPSLVKVGKFTNNHQNK